MATKSIGQVKRRKILSNNSGYPIVVPKASGRILQTTLILTIQALVEKPKTLPESMLAKKPPVTSGTKKIKLMKPEKKKLRIVVPSPRRSDEIRPPDEARTTKRPTTPTDDHQDECFSYGGKRYSNAFSFLCLDPYLKLRILKKSPIAPYCEKYTKIAEDRKKSKDKKQNKTSFIEAGCCCCYGTTEIPIELFAIGHDKSEKESEEQFKKKKNAVAIILHYVFQKVHSCEGYRERLVSASRVPDVY